MRDDVVGDEPAVHIEYCGEWMSVRPGEVFTVGSDADLAIDDNPFLHRRLLEITEFEGLWVIRNVGARLVVAVSDGSGRLQSWLAPGAWLPLVFGRTTIVFSAGPTTYEMTLMVAEPIFSESPRSAIEETPEPVP